MPPYNHHNTWFKRGIKYVSQLTSYAMLKILPKYCYIGVSKLSSPGMLTYENITQDTFYP